MFAVNIALLRLDKACRELALIDCSGSEQSSFPVPQDVLSTFLFGIGPQMFDIIVSCAYLASALQPWIALIVFVLLITYIPLRSAAALELSIPSALRHCTIIRLTIQKLRIQHHS